MKGKMLPKTLVCCLPGVVLLAMLLYPSSAHAQAKKAELTRMTVAPTTSSVIWHAEYFLAEWLGFFKKENLEVEIVTGDRGTVHGALLAKRLTVGGVSQANYIPLIAKQGQQPLKWFMLTQMYAFWIFVPENSPYREAKDLVGKTIGLRENADVPTVNLLMAMEGVRPNQYEAVAMGGRAAYVPALEKRRIDACYGTGVDKAFVEAAGVKVRVIKTGETSQWYNSAEMAHVDTIKDKPDVLIRYGRALTKGLAWRYTASPEAVIDILAKARPEAVKDRQASIMVFKAAVESNRGAFDNKLQMHGKVWQSTADAFYKHRVIDNPADMTSTYTNELLGEIWNFDVEAVRKDARSYSEKLR